MIFFFFFFNDTATTEIYTLSLHDALPISMTADDNSPVSDPRAQYRGAASQVGARQTLQIAGDRKSTRLNSSHSQISYAVFCLKKKKKKRITCARGSEIYQAVCEEDHRRQR